MRSKEIRSLPMVGGLTSRREVLRRGAIVAAVSAIAPMWTRHAWAQTASGTFDYYISTTGSDSNAGTLAQPWAITSLNRTNGNNSKMKGKRVGMLPGKYAIYSMWNSGAYGWQTPVLNLPSGSAGARTFLGASDASGNQTIGGVNITASLTGIPGGTVPGTSSSSIAMIGKDYRDTDGGHCQIDGLVLSDCTNLIVSYYTGTDMWVTNCHVYNCWGDEGNNTGAIWFGGGATNGGVQNCLIHDVTIAGSGTLHNCAGIFTEDTIGNLYEYNTIYNCNCGIYDKNQNDGGHTYRYNYIEVNGLNPFNCLMDCAGGPAGTTSKVYNNVFVIAPGANTERSFWQGICTNGPGANPTQAMQFYNNTCFVLNGGGVEMGVTYQSSGAGSVTHYNNIYVAAAPGFYDTVNFNTSSSAIAISDYNAYIGGCGDHMGRGTNGAPSSNYTLANWQSSFSLDTHSFNQASASGVFQSPGGAQNPGGYQLASGSPCKSTGRSGGTAGGAAVDMGAWGGTDVNTGGAISRIGCNLAAPIVSTTSPPDAPVLSVS